MAIGSEIFETSVMKTNEYLLMAKVIKENGETDIAKIDADIRFIDDFLAMARIQCVSNALRRTKTGGLRKNLHYGAFLDSRLQKLIDQE